MSPLYFGRQRGVCYLFVALSCKRCVHTVATRGLSRPEIGLHFLVNNPDTSLHNLFNPEYRLHLPNRMKRKRALLKSNSSGIIWSDAHTTPLWSLHFVTDFAFICTSVYS